jgi:hypothetical protein
LRKVRFSVGLLILVLLAVATPVASAASTTQASAKVQTVSMKLDCEHLTPKAKKYADEHHYCDKKSSPVNPKASTTTNGNCGSATLAIYQGYDSGIANFYQSTHSILGPITYVNRQLNWTNWTVGKGNATFDGFAAFGDWYHTDTYNTQPGYVTGYMSGSVWLAWGGMCTIINPDTYAQIS